MGQQAKGIDMRRVCDVSSLTILLLNDPASDRKASDVAGKPGIYDKNLESL